MSNTPPGSGLSLPPLRYALITAARDEQEFIGRTIESVTSQTVPPERWVIVDDGSTDRTFEIATSRAASRPWIKVLRLPVRRERDFAGKVRAFDAGYHQLADLRFDLIANLDADVSLEVDHFEFLIEQFLLDPTLGVAGTIYSQPGFDSVLHSFEGEQSVAGPLQVFRRECFENIGGYRPNPLGGIDWIAVMNARMSGWRTRNFTGRKYYHHRAMGTATKSPVGAMFAYGVKDYFLGGSPVWELFRAAYRATKPPLVVGGLALLSGYCLAALRRIERPISPELLRFHRHEQHGTLKRILRSALTLGPIEKR
jgi:glycosyltransferase involved in cell wall biosynthesis